MRGVIVSIAAAELFSLIGAPGSGKTTLRQLSAGSVFIAGHDVAVLPG